MSRHGLHAAFLILSFWATSAPAPASAAGPDPSIRTWGQARVPPREPLFDSPDIRVDADAGELTATIRNRGTATARFRVSFWECPDEVCRWIASRDEVRGLMPSARRDYTIAWEAGPYLDGTPLRVTIESLAQKPLEDAAPWNNTAWDRSVEVQDATTACKGAGIWVKDGSLRLNNKKDYAQTVALEARSSDVQAGVVFPELHNPELIVLAPFEERIVDARVVVTAQSDVCLGKDVTIDLLQLWSDQVVRGTTLILRSRLSD